MFTTHHFQVTQNTMAMHDACWTADDQPAIGIRTSTLASIKHKIIWHSGHKSTCYAGRHRHGTHPTSHRVISTAYTDSCLPLTMKLVNSFIILNLVNCFTFSKLVNSCIMLKHVNNTFLFSILPGDALVQGAVGCSTCTFWSGIIRRSGTCIGREQAPDRVLPVDFPTRLTHPLS